MTMFKLTIDINEEKLKAVAKERGVKITSLEDVLKNEFEWLKESGFILKDISKIEENIVSVNKITVEDMLELCRNPRKSSEFIVDYYNNLPKEAREKINGMYYSYYAYLSDEVFDMFAFPGLRKLLEFNGFKVERKYIKENEGEVVISKDEYVFVMKWTAGMNDSLISNFVDTKTIKCISHKCQPVFPNWFKEANKDALPYLKELWIKGYVSINDNKIKEIVFDMIIRYSDYLIEQIGEKTLALT